MSYGAQFVLSFLEQRIGTRAAKQIIYIILLVFSTPQSKISEEYGASRTTISKYNKALRNEDLQGIFDQEYNHPVSELEKYAKEIEAEFEANPPKNRTDAQARIKKITNLERGLTQIGKFLKKRASNPLP